jgi:hypothetical protein
MDGLPGEYWLLRLAVTMRDERAMAEFEHVLVMHTGHDLANDAAFTDASIPMYPVLRRVEPGEHVSFDGELLAGVKATIRRS